MTKKLFLNLPILLFAHVSHGQRHSLFDLPGDRALVYFPSQGKGEVIRIQQKEDFLSMLYVYFDAAGMGGSSYKKVTIANINMENLPRKFNLGAMPHLPEKKYLIVHELTPEALKIEHNLGVWDEVRVESFSTIRGEEYHSCDPKVVPEAPFVTYEPQHPIVSRAEYISGDQCLISFAVPAYQPFAGAESSCLSLGSSWRVATKDDVEKIAIFGTWSGHRYWILDSSAEKVLSLNSFSFGGDFGASHRFDNDPNLLNSRYTLCVSRTNGA